MATMTEDNILGGQSKYHRRKHQEYSPWQRIYMEDTMTEDNMLGGQSKYHRRKH